ncbi:zinc-finger homeodomain protein 2-like [Mercurialis annua]|uniref:zinc-finger homeodomain protein 2-like n=1 Tax=Mercurialis annua TaxID=3986 RepID=UPI00215F6F39|nr:zinc-finger homeodomain protein 2-like [Mercurialis annua]
MDLTLVPYQHFSTNHNNISTYVKYKECMKNHAASIGGHANDGCGEFMPRGSDDHSLTCAACGCHRNFHRRETAADAATNARHHHHQLRHFEHLMLSPSPPPLLHGVSVVNKKHLITASPPDAHCDDILEDINDDHDRRSETPEREEVGHHVGLMASRSPSSSAKNKRFRTKFTPDQKEKMLNFADKIGWRINKNDDGAFNQFCNEIGVKRNVLKVWMHNNKNVHRRRDHDVQEHPSNVATAAVAHPPPPVASQAIGV